MASGGGESADPVVIVRVQGGQDVAIPILSPAPGDAVAVFPLLGGGEATTVILSLAAGDTVAVVPLRGGGEVALPLTVSLPDPYGDCWLISAVPTWSAEQNIRVRARIKRLPGGAGVSSVTFGVAINAGTPNDATIDLTLSDIGEEYETIVSPDLSIYSGATRCWAMFHLTYAAYVRISSVEYSVNGGGTWALVNDGEFASGAFVEDAFTSPGWQLTDGNLHARFATVGAGYQVETYR